MALRISSVGSWASLKETRTSSPRVSGATCKICCPSCGAKANTDRRTKAVRGNIRLCRNDTPKSPKSVLFLAGDSPCRGGPGTESLDAQVRKFPYIDFVRCPTIDSVDQAEFFD